MTTDSSKFCAALDEWAELMCSAKEHRGTADASYFEEAWRHIRQLIMKSCLLSRTIYGGEKPSKTPCPVHKGVWIGIHIGWPGQKWSDGTLVEESSQCREWYDAGCRCFLHTCGCTTGWQVDEHCGCGVKP